MVNYFNYNENRSIYAKYVSLESNYKKEDEFNDVDIKNYIEANKEDLKIDFIDVKYAKLTPEILTGSSEYNENYYKIIDEINVFASGKDGIFSPGTPIGMTNLDGEVELFVDPNQLSFVTVNLSVQNLGKL